MGREKSTELFSFEARKCPCSLFLVENSGCCRDEHEVLSIDDSQSLAASLPPISPDLFLIGSTFSLVQEASLIEQSFTQLVIEFYPPPKGPIYKGYL